MKIHEPPLSRTETCEKHGVYVSLCYWGSLWTVCPDCEKAQAELWEAERLAARAAERVRLWQQVCPPRYRSAQLEPLGKKQAEAIEAASVLARSGRGHLILIGGVGVGKTHIACAAAAQSAMQSGRIPAYTTVAEACEVANSYHAWREWRALKMAPLLVLDEVPAMTDQKGAAAIFDLLDARYRGRRCNIICANLSLAELTRVLGVRVIDRLRDDGARVVVMEGASLRTGHD